MDRVSIRDVVREASVSITTVSKALNNYSKLFADTSAAQVSKGRAVSQDTLDVAGSVLAITGSALSIALAIKKASHTMCI